MKCEICNQLEECSVKDMQLAISYFENGDFNKAFKAALPLAEKENVAAQCMIGSFLMTGMGVEANDVAAEKWLTKAGTQGCGLAWSNLSALYLTGGKTLLPNRDKARECLSKAKENGFDANYI